MNRSDEPLFDSRIADWLENDPYEAPPQALEVVLAAFPSINQRRAWRAPWRAARMNAPLRLGLVVAAVVIAAVGGIYLIGQRPAGVGSVPPPPTAPGATPAPSSQAAPSNALLDTNTWVAYTSDRYGFTISHPGDWTERPSDHVWALPADADWLSTAPEGFIAPGAAIRVSAWSVAVPPGTTVDSWLQTYCPLNTTPCTGLQSLTTPTNMDGHAGSLVQFKDDTQAFTLVGDRMYVVAVWEPDNDPRTTPYGGAVRLLEAYLSTMHLLPGGPGSSTPSAALS